MKTDKPKPTGEWTVFGTSVKRLGDDDSLFHCSTRTDADVAVRTHNTALAAERELGQQECNRLDAFWQNEVARQLADERETISPEMQPNGCIDRKDKALREQAQIIAGLHQQLAAAFKRGKLEGVFASPDEGEVNYVTGLEQQLAAEREKVNILERKMGVLKALTK